MTPDPSSGADATPPPDDHDSRTDRAAWGEPSHGESRWPPLLAILTAIALQVVLPNRLVEGLGPKLLVPALEIVLLVAVAIANPHREDRAQSNLRLLSLAMIALITAVNVVALGELIRALLDSTPAGGRTLVFASVPIWLTNVIAFGLWYWELDRGGVTARRTPTPPGSRLPLPADDDPGGGAGLGPAVPRLPLHRRSPTPPPSARRTPCRSPRGPRC